MLILGITGTTHDVSACLLRDGEIVAAVEEERLVRVKHSTGRHYNFPRRAIQFCLSKGGVKIEDLSYIAVGLKARPEAPAELQTEVERDIQQWMRYVPRTLSVSEWMLLRLHQELGTLPNVRFIDHHLAHAAGAFRLSGLRQSNILTIDYLGDVVSTLLAFGEESKITKISEIFIPHSLGRLYAELTTFLGFQYLSDEFKVMALSSYGSPVYLDFFLNNIRLMQNGFEFSDSFQGTDDPTFHAFLDENLGPHRARFDPIEQRHKDIAASLQRALELTVLHLVSELIRCTGSRNLCMSGGVALNCKMNGEIIKSGCVEKLHVQPAANDAGTSIGAALELYYQLTGESPKVVENIYLGPDYPNSEVLAILNRLKISNYKKCDDIALDCARLLANGSIVGWFQGRMEFGPRALGNRSILADPTDPSMKDKVNALVKNREQWRPFAPAVLAECASEYFRLVFDSPFMTIIFDTFKEMRSDIPTVIHVDGSSRIQTVSKETDSQFWRLIKEFEAIKNVPMVLNTSLNVRGEPIICKPQEAIKLLYGTGLDYLALNDFLLWK